MKKTFFILLLASCASKQRQNHAHRQLGFYKPKDKLMNGKQVIVLPYQCVDTKMDTTVFTTVDSVDYYVEYMHSTMPYRYK